MLAHALMHARTRTYVVKRVDALVCMCVCARARGLAYVREFISAWVLES